MEGTRKSPESGSKRTRSAEDDLSSFGVNAALVEEIRQRYEVDPSSVDESWSELFGDGAGADPGSIAPSRPQTSQGTPEESSNAELADRHARVLRLIHAYRARGHRIAGTDPLGSRTSYFPELDPAHYGFGSDDLDNAYMAGDLPGGTIQVLSEILERLRRTYCRVIGVEFTHVQDPGRRTWLQSVMEQSENQSSLHATERLGILEKLAAAELFENFVHTKFLGQKRFSLEGAECLIPLLDTIVEGAPEKGIDELVIGMAHRGRLNVLSNVLGKSVASIFSEFEDNPLADSPFGSGDVKYHKGYSNDRVTRCGKTVHLSLTANPSHLEAVGPVVEGRVRAKQVRRGDENGEQVLPVLVHGDAAFAGQGIVAETLNLSQLVGFSTGGTIHVVVNNQIGFTTPPDEARSTLYATDVAKMIQVPIFHVNGDEPEAVVHCVKLAMEYRRRFREDVVIDMVCYRRHGHNEGDEPSFTQPLLYEKIRARNSVRERYTQELLELGILRADDVSRIESDLKNQLSQALEGIQTRPPGPDEPYEPRGPWTGYSRTLPIEDPETGIAEDRLLQLAEQIGSVPEGFSLHPKLATVLEKRRKCVSDSLPIDWGTAELLAFGSLVLEGTPVRLTGQDSVRGTFSHRHASVIDQKNADEYVALAHLSSGQARFEVYDSLLSEAAVLGFEYGYSLADPTTLTLWEAQFGDFANGAQVIIDQFITSAHVKWQRMSGLVMLLPHGYEGQGPEHSSARVERFLQSCASDNLQIVNCTTPAQYFHVLRRQMLRRFRSPMVIFTPKSLLRSPVATSDARELTTGRFSKVIDDERFVAAPGSARRIVFCSGKLYYDLIAECERRWPDQPGPIAIVRVEQLYPWPADEIDRVISKYPSAGTVVWSQEEPENMGGWGFLHDRLRDALRSGQELFHASRSEAASTAVGSIRIHRDEQRALVNKALAGVDGEE
ncbi:2-oxoglutarate dehydrogenase E1 component [Myxococcota bacterium]|nr:2-oxoglutarate dehydrogenase E1 component [Myxococcota bacterium]